MSIDKNTVLRVAKLARIRTPETEADKLSGELSKILAMISELQAVDTKGVEPLTSVVDITLQARPDKVTDGDRAQDILANAPEETAGFFVVPKIVE